MLKATSIDRHSNVLILDAHRGPGLLINQQLVSLGVKAKLHSASTTCGKGSLISSSQSFFGNALDLLRQFDSSTFDVVIDTIGGKDIWEECRRILRENGSVRVYTAVGSRF